MTVVRRGPAGWTLLAVVGLIALAGCTVDDTSGSPSATTPAPAAGAPGRDAFARGMIEPISAWRTSYRNGPLGVAIPGTVVGTAIADGQVRLVADGHAVMGSQPMASDGAFHIGSMTKLFTAALILQLDQEGVLSVDDTIDTWFPTAPNARRSR